MTSFLNSEKTRKNNGFLVHSLERAMPRGPRTQDIEKSIVSSCTQPPPPRRRNLLLLLWGGEGCSQRRRATAIRPRFVSRSSFKKADSTHCYISCRSRQSRNQEAFCCRMAEAVPSSWLLETIVSFLRSPSYKVIFRRTPALQSFFPISHIYICSLAISVPLVPHTHRCAGANDGIHRHSLRRVHWRGRK